MANRPPAAGDNGKKKNKAVSVIPVVHDVFSLVKEANLPVLERMILREELNVNLARWSGFTLLHRAATEGQTDVCDLLITHGARINQRSVWGWYTPLHLALANGYEDTAKYLIEKGANVRALSKYREDCCDYAVKRGYKELAAEFRVRMARLEIAQLAEAKKIKAEKNAELLKQASLERARIGSLLSSPPTLSDGGDDLATLDKELGRLEKY